MDKRKKIISILAGLMALVMLLGLIAGVLPTRVSAYSSSELKKQLNAMKQEQAGIAAQIRSLRNQISENTSEIQRMVTEKNVIDQEIFLLHQQIANINDQISTYNLLIADKQDELDAAQARFDQLLRDNKSRIQAMEEAGDLSYWSVLFQANSFADLLDRLNMIQEIAASDQRRLKELNKAAEVVAEAKAELEEEKVGLEETKITLDETQAEMEAKREEADALLVELVARGMEYEELVAMSEIAQAQLAVEIANKEDEYDRAVYREWLATSVPPTTQPKPLPPSQTDPSDTATTVPSESTEPGETTDPTEAPTETPTEAPTEAPTEPADEGWIVPIRYTAFTSAFGYRDAPTAGASTYHQGVDLAAPTGTPIYASRSGTVSTATYSSDCGYYVQINHGDGYRSIYMHMTHYVVYSGQHVSQGQVIGYCGSTGISTGSHLHFGISKNGTYVNPAYYIPI